MQQQTGKKQIHTRNGVNSRIIFLLVAVVILIYLGQKIISAFSIGIETTPAIQVTVNDSITAQGWFFRDEIPISGSTGKSVKHIVYSGERVQQSAPLAIVYSDEDALALSQQLDPLENRIDLLNTALQSATDGADASKLDQMIILSLQQMASQTKNGSGTALHSSAESLRTLALRREADSVDTAAITAERDTLVMERDSLNAQLAGHTTQLTAPATGYFSEVVDGYEGILTLDELEDITVDRFHDLTETKPIVSEQAWGKMIQGFTWYLVAEISQEDADRFSVGQSLHVNFTQASLETPVSVYSVIKDRTSETALVVLAGTEFNSEMVSMRQQPIEIIIATYTGLKVPKEAVYVQETTTSDGKTQKEDGVFILSGSFQKFKIINKLYETEDYYVVEQSATNSDMLVAQDQIIISGKNLQNNMVVKT
ncbi:HlyD family efflux transporter periplasmic adaptor subunit [Agathobaculum sp. Marseille-P7918]|uniref:HlyD family efflux transporter periplasmic adaptor subunit n=1 Tax=Agathobaculum sp. Marseille-P7918 TaxID=2479843 RepID=UPI003564B08E